MQTSVDDMNTKGQYLSFYNPMHRNNNKVYDKVYRNYKEAMKQLEDAKIVKRL